MLPYLASKVVNFRKRTLISPGSCPVPYPFFLPPPPLIRFAPTWWTKRGTFRFSLLPFYNSRWRIGIESWISNLVYDRSNGKHFDWGGLSALFCWKCRIIFPYKIYNRGNQNLICLHCRSFSKKEASENKLRI